MDLYVRLGHEPFDMQIRTPLEFVDLEYSKARISANDCIFRYVFVKADVKRLMELLLLQQRGKCELRLLKDPLKGGSEMAKTNDEEIDRFFRFCEAYRLFYGADKPVNFVKLLPDVIASGDVVEIMQEGQFKGVKAIVETMLENEQVSVIVTWFGLTGVRMVFQKSDLLLIRQAKYANNRFAAFDEFFDFLLQPEVFERYQQNSPSGVEIAKALHIKELAHYDEHPGRHASRDSKRVRMLNLAALIAASRILGDTDSLRTYLTQWQNFTSKSEQQIAPDKILKLIII